MRKRSILNRAAGALLLGAVLAGPLAGRAHAQSGETPWLGVTTQEITRDLRDGLDYGGSGVLVNRVVNDSPADRAGVRSGDVIASFNSRTVSTPQELTRLVRASRVGQSVSLTIVRDGDRRTLNARLGAWPASRDGDEDRFEVPEAPEAPEAPRAPRAPRTPRVFEWDGDRFGTPGGQGMRIFTSGRGRLGVQVQDLNEGLADALGVPGGRGVLIMEVHEDTPAQRAGMRAGDVIVRVEDRSIESVDELHRALERDGRFSLTVIRRGERRTIEAEIERRATPRPQTLRRGQTLRIPDIRTRVMRDLERDRSEGRDGDRSRMQEELEELRREVRELRRKLEDLDRN